MAELARNYHSTLQDQGIKENKTEEVETKIEDILSEIPENQKFLNPETSELNYSITEDHIEDALKSAKMAQPQDWTGAHTNWGKSLRNRMIKWLKPRKEDSTL
jgi:hypothetical protein